MVPIKFLDIPDLLRDRELAYQNSLQNHEYNKRRYDRNRIDISFSVGDKVYVENGNKLNRDKLDPIRIGPFVIKRKLSASVYEIDVGYKTCSKRLYHISKLISSVSL